MSETLPSVTVIIAARPDQAEIKAVTAAQQLDYPVDRLEILVARGKQPSVQRNEAVRAAAGDWLYFLDDDSVPGPGNLRRALTHMAGGDVQMVGGPNLCPAAATELEHIFAVVLGSWLAFGPSRARYARVGDARPASEKELILCNLMARRGPFLELGGFNEALYPNEENALMDELQARGGKLIYDPEFSVERHPRRTLRSFARMLMTYGRGRAEQFREHPTAGSFLNFIPPLFAAYLAAWLAFVLAAPGSRVARWGALPFALYGLAVLLQTIVSGFKAGAGRSLAAMPLLALSPILYGIGFWRGLFTPLRADKNRARADVRLERIAPLQRSSR